MQSKIPIDYYVYCYYDPSRNNEPIYVGYGHGKRWANHLTRKDTHPLTQRLQKMKREGINPTVNFIAEHISYEEAVKIEIQQIEKLGRKDLMRGTLLNLTNGGEGVQGLKHSAEAKQKMSLSKKGKPWSEQARAAIMSARKPKIKSDQNIQEHTFTKGKKFSDTHCENISRVTRGKAKSPETRKKLSLAMKTRFQVKTNEAQ